MKKIKITLKKCKRGDVISIDWIDAGDLDDSPSSLFSQEEAEKVFKEIPVQTIAVYFGHGKENLFLVWDTEKQDIKSLYYNGACVIPIGCIRSVVKLSDWKNELAIQIKIPILPDFKKLLSEVPTPIDKNTPYFPHMDNDSLNRVIRKYFMRGYN